MWPFTKHVEKPVIRAVEPEPEFMGEPIEFDEVMEEAPPTPAPIAVRGRIGTDTSGGAQRAKAQADAAVAVKVYRAAEDRWYTIDEIRAQEK